jgi:hypothetical protein
MPTDIINNDELRLFKCGTNQAKVWINDYIATIEILGTCSGNGNNFLALNKQDWDRLKKFIDAKLTDSFFIESTPQK